MNLKNRSGDLRSDGACERLFNDLLLRLTVCYENDLLSSHNSADTHGDRLSRNVIARSKESCICVDGRLVKINYSGSKIEMIVGLVEADVTVKTDTKHLEVGSANALDVCVVISALLCGVLSDTAGNASILLINVYVVEEIGVHEITVALLVASVKAYVLVKVYGARQARLISLAFAP